MRKTSVSLMKCNHFACLLTTTARRYPSIYHPSAAPLVKLLPFLLPSYSLVCPRFIYLFIFPGDSWCEVAHSHPWACVDATSQAAGVMWSHGGMQAFTHAWGKALLAREGALNFEVFMCCRLLKKKNLEIPKKKQVLFASHPALKLSSQLHYYYYCLTGLSLSLCKLNILW